MRGGVRRAERGARLWHGLGRDDPVWLVEGRAMVDPARRGGTCLDWLRTVRDHLAGRPVIPDPGTAREPR